MKETQAFEDLIEGGSQYQLDEAKVTRKVAKQLQAEGRDATKALAEDLVRAEKNLKLESLDNADGEMTVLEFIDRTCQFLRKKDDRHHDNLSGGCGGQWPW